MMYGVILFKCQIIISVINYFSFSFLLISLFAYSFGFSQSEIISELIIVDTTTYNGKSIYVFNDKSWEYSENYNVEYYYETVRDNLGCVIFDKDVLMNINWNENKTFSNQYNLAKANDTILINISGYVPPEGRISSHFKFRWGRWHKGTDYALAVGTPIKASFDGVVRYSKYNMGGYGELIIIRHYNGLETYYAHLSSRLVKSGDIVSAGEVIGYSGNTGHSTAPHLHYEVRILDNAINPELLKTEENILAIHSSLFIANSKIGKPILLKDIFNIKEANSKGEYTRSVVNINRTRKRQTSSNY